MGLEEGIGGRWEVGEKKEKLLTSPDLLLFSPFLSNSLPFPRLFCVARRLSTEFAPAFTFFFFLFLDLLKRQ